MKRSKLSSFSPICLESPLLAGCWSLLYVLELEFFLNGQEVNLGESYGEFLMCLAKENEMYPSVCAKLGEAFSDRNIVRNGGIMNNILRDLPACLDSHF